MKKLIFYSLMSILLVTVFACKHSSKKDEKAPKHSENQTSVLDEKELVQESDETPVTDDTVLKNVAKVTAGDEGTLELVKETVSDNEEISSGLSIQDLSKLSSVIYDFLKNTTISLLSNTKHPDYYRLRIKKDGNIMYKIFNNKTQKYEPTLYSIFDDFVKVTVNKTEIYATRVRVAASDSNEPNQYKVLNGDLTPVVPAFKYEEISSFKQEDFSYVQRATNEVVISKGIHAKALDSSNAIGFIYVDGKQTSAYYAQIPNFPDYLVLLNTTQGSCNVLSFHIHDVQSDSEFISETKDNIPYMNFINKITVTDSTGNTETKEKPSCTTVSSWLNSINNSSTVEYTIYSKSFTAHYYF